MGQEERLTARADELAEQVAERDRRLAEMQRAAAAQEQELLAKVERVQQYVKERQAGALHAETRSAVAEQARVGACEEVRRVSADRDRLQRLLLDAEDRARGLTARYEARLAEADALVGDAQARCLAAEKENREKNLELLGKRDAEHQVKVGAERQREQSRYSALLRRKDSDLQVSEAKVKSLRARVQELTA